MSSHTRHDKLFWMRQQCKGTWIDDTAILNEMVVHLNEDVFEQFYCYFMNKYGIERAPEDPIFDPSCIRDE